MIALLLLSHLCVRVADLLGIRVFVLRNRDAVRKAVPRKHDEHCSQKKHENPCPERDPEPDERKSDQKVQREQDPGRDAPKNIQHRMPYETQEEPAAFLLFRLFRRCRLLCKLFLIYYSELLYKLQMQFCDIYAILM